MKNDIQNIPGLGGLSPVTDAQYGVMKTELETIVNDFQGGSVNTSVDYEQQVRFCIWNGQSSDGRKHAEDLGQEPHPFEGAPDTRIRLADSIINYLTAIQLAATSRANLTVRGAESNDHAFAHHIHTLLKWVTSTQLGARHRRELKKLLNMIHGDNPGAAVLWVDWENDTELAPQPVTLPDIALHLALLAQPQDEMQLADLVTTNTDLLLNPETETLALDALKAYRPGLTTGEARRFLGKLRPATVDADNPAGESGPLEDYPVVEFPMPRLRLNAPCVRAMRLNHDIFIPANTRDYQKSRVIYTRELLTRSQVQARAADPENGWTATQVTALIGTGKDGNNGLVDKTHLPWVDHQTTTDGQVRTHQTLEPTRGLYEIFTAWHRATNREGATGVYRVDFNPSLDKPLGPRRLSPYSHGDYPGVFFARETVNHPLTDTRGVPEIVTADQTLIKQYTDTSGAHAQLRAFPPLRHPLNRGGIGIKLQPLGRIPERKVGEIQPFDIGDGSRETDSMIAATQRRVAEYFGLPIEGASPALVQALLQETVDDFLGGYRDVLKQIVQLCQQYLSDDDIALIIGTQNIDMPRDRSSIQGQFDIDIAFDARELDDEYTTKRITAISKLILPMDTQGTLLRDKLVHRALSMIDPNLAEGVTQEVTAANQSEQNDEQNNYLKIANGIPVEMVESGQDHALRSQVLGQLAQANAQSIQQWPPQNQQALQQRLQHLNHMVQQQQNAYTGRVGANPATAQQNYDQLTATPGPIAG